MYCLSPSIVQSIEQDLFELEIGHLSIQKILNPTVENSMRSQLSVNDCEVTKITDSVVGRSHCELCKEENSASFTFSENIRLSGDMIIIFGIKNPHTQKRKEIGRIGLHSAFLPQNLVKLSKLEIDGVHRKDIVSQDFRVEILFREISNNDTTNKKNHLSEPSLYSFDSILSPISHKLKKSELFSLPSTCTTMNHFAFIYSKDYALSYHRYVKDHVRLEKALETNPTLEQTLSPAVLFSNQFIHPRPMPLKVRLIAHSNEQDVHTHGKFISVSITIG
ncbi:hypothetical protein C9374_006291 [Naegleria lovaniensis]|uniref:C2 tensin-type domain-containing protein n=1 Tax=Naegleria lovaniensis TaxID=51637 RepID=A0AA88KHM5_NAELO|nr:uncharacterized protein C9374_006291 [Naegleria lovaniensis]KAG2381302.1 hypothetical protein C9374_006291 [Naegleria lovaniensis]